MRKAFVQCRARSTAKRRCPWAAVVAAADGGYWCFETVDAYKEWRGQK